MDMTIIEQILNLILLVITLRKLKEFIQGLMAASDPEKYIKEAVKAHPHLKELLETHPKFAEMIKQHVAAVKVKAQNPAAPTMPKDVENSKAGPGERGLREANGFDFGIFSHGFAAKQC